jgi:hypothetical protein
LVVAMSGVFCLLLLREQARRGHPESRRQNPKCPPHFPVNHVLGPPLALTVKKDLNWAKDGRGLARKAGLFRDLNTYRSSALPFIALQATAALGVDSD